MTETPERVAYDSFRNGCCVSLPQWQELPDWIRDAMKVAYLQGILDAEPNTRAPSTVGVEELRRIHSALDDALGDSDVTHIEDDNELRKRHPAQWAAEQLAKLIDGASTLASEKKGGKWIDQNYQIDRYGVALMMIREGCSDPAGLARRILTEFGNFAPPATSLIAKEEERTGPCPHCAAMPDFPHRPWCKLAPALPDGEAVAWQYRFKHGDWTKWIFVDMPFEDFKCEQKRGLDCGTVELRPLYTSPPPASAGAREALEKAEIALFPKLTSQQALAYDAVRDAIRSLASGEKK